jgi:hypothetical protein
MPVAERRQRFAAQPRLDGLGDVAALLLGRRRDAADLLAVGAVDGDGVAYGEDIGGGRAP